MAALGAKSRSSVADVAWQPMGGPLSPGNSAAASWLTVAFQRQVEALERPSVAKLRRSVRVVIVLLQVDPESAFGEKAPLQDEKKLVGPSCAVTGIESALKNKARRNPNQRLNSAKQGERF